MGFPNPKKEAEKAIRKAIDKVLKPAIKAGESALNSVTKGGEAAIWKVRREAYAKIKEVGAAGEDAVKAVGKEAEKGVKTVERECEGNIRKVGKEIEDGLTEKLPEMIEDEAHKVLKELQQAVSKEALKTFRDVVKSAKAELDKLQASKPNLVDAINRFSVTFNPGPLTLVYADFYSRADDISDSLDHYVNNPPVFTRTSFLGIIRAIAPTSIDLGISVNFALVVGSKELGIGGSLGDISTELFLELGDVLLEKLGVPE